MLIGLLLGGRFTISFPKTFKSPFVMSSKPAINLKSVVLPQPEGPKRVKNSLSLIVRFASFKAVTEFSPTP